jgi:hypothetical protein
MRESVRYLCLRNKEIKEDIATVRSQILRKKQMDLEKNT